MPIPTIHTRRYNSLTLGTILNLDSAARNNQTSTTFDFGLAYQILKVKLLSHVQLFATPWTIAHQAPPCMEFYRQEYWSGLPFPSPGDLPNPQIVPGSPILQADTLPSEPPGIPNLKDKTKKNSSLYKLLEVQKKTEAHIEIQKYSVPNKMKFTIIGIQLKVTRHAKKQENVAHNKEKNQTTEMRQNQCRC